MCLNVHNSNAYIIWSSKLPIRVSLRASISSFNTVSCADIEIYTIKPLATCVNYIYFISLITLFRKKMYYLVEEILWIDEARYSVEKYWFQASSISHAVHCKYPSYSNRRRFDTKNLPNLILFS